MTTRVPRFVPAVLLLTVALPAAAASVVATPPQYQVSPNLNQCIIANPGTKDVAVPRLELVNQGGVALVATNNLLLAPGEITSVSASGGGLTFCRAIGVSAKKIRLSHCVRTTNSGSPCVSTTTGE